MVSRITNTAVLSNLPVFHEIGGFIKGRFQLLAQFRIDTGIFHCLTHAYHPLVAFAIADSKGHVALAQARVTILFHIELRSAEPAGEEHEEFLLGYSQV